MLSRYTREYNQIFIDSNPITGIQSIASSYESPLENIRYLGQNDNILNNVPIGLFVGAVNLEALLVNSDPFIKYTGELPANIMIQYENNKIIMNSGYLTEYNFDCGIGTIPSVTSKWNIYNEFGSGIANSLPFSIDESRLNIVNPGDIEINFSEIEREKVNNLSINVRSNRLPIYDATDSKPKEVKLQYPVAVTVTYSISLNDYKMKNLYDYPRKKHKYDFTINLKKNNTNTIINSFQINDAYLIKEDYNTDVDGSALMQLTYSSTITR